MCKKVRKVRLCSFLFWFSEEQETSAYVRILQWSIFGRPREKFLKIFLTHCVPRVIVMLVMDIHHSLNMGNRERAAARFHKSGHSTER